MASRWSPRTTTATFYWFPYTDRVQIKTNNRVAADDRPLSRFRGWLDDDFLSNTVFDGVCRLGRAVPALVPPINAVSARALTERTLHRAVGPGLLHAAAGPLHRDGVRHAARRAARRCSPRCRRLVDRLPFKVQFPVEVRFTAAGRHLAVARVRAGLRLHRGAPVRRAHRTSRTSGRSRSSALALGGRPHWGKLHYRDAASLRPAYPRCDDFLAVRERLDPRRVFANEYTAQVLGA